MANFADVVKKILQEHDPNLDMSGGTAAQDILVNAPEYVLNYIFSAMKKLEDERDTSDVTLLELAKLDRVGNQLFVSRGEGIKSTGVVRMYFIVPTTKTCPAGTIFETSRGLKFVSKRSTTITDSQMALNIEGKYYYMDIPSIEAVEAGAQYSISSFAVVRMVGQPADVVKVTNPNEFTTGANAQKETKAFQVKLKGNPSSCYALDGTPGYTGASVVPKLKFDWAWDNISSDQCSSDNPNYTYCDATQFTTSLFKRIAEIQTLMNNGRYESIPAKTAFYAYLIKDNYSPNFTTDFGNYYANQAFSPTLFQDPRYPKILTENKLSFTNRAADGTLGGAMPYGGLYRVEINLGLTGASNSLFDASGSLYSPITVTFAPEQKAQNYNPFYETPFDGEVGLLNGAVTRTNYGTSISGGDLALNSAGIKAAGYTGAVTTLGLDTSANLSTLAQRNVLVYDATAKMLRFYPSQPTPVIMNVTGTGAGTTAAYNYKTGNNPEASAPNQEWRMVSSTMGSAKCEDFDGQQKTIFTDSGTSTKSIKWNGNGKGTVGLATMFFTANASDHTLTPTSANPVTLTSFPRLVTGSTNVLLKNYDYPTSPNYNTAYTKLQGVFDMISNETLCMSQSSESTMKVWWNSAYLDNLLAQANGSSSYTCN